MPLDFQSIHIPFTGGLDTKTSAPLVPVTEFLELENAIFDKSGALKKRWGYDAKGSSILGSSSSSMTALEGGTAFLGELVGFSGKKAYSHLAGTNGWVDRGNVTSVIATTTPVMHSASQQQDPDIARIGDMTATVWIEDGVAKATIVDSTGARIIHNQTLSTGSSNMKPRVVAFGNDFVFFWVTTQFLWYRVVNRFSPGTLAAAINLTAGVHATDNNFDVLVNGARLFVTWNNASSLPTLMYLDSSYATSSATWTASGGSPAASAALSLWSDDQNGVWVGWANAARAVRVTRATYNLDVPAATNTVTIETAPFEVMRITGIVPAGTTTAQIYYDQDTDPSSVASRFAVRKATMTTAGTVVVSGYFIRSVGIVARPFEFDSVQYLPVLHESTLQCTYFVVNCSDGSVVARISPTTGGGNRLYSTLSNIINEDDVFTFAHLEKGRLASADGGVYSQIGVAWTELDFASSRRYATQVVDRSLLVVGGVLQSYDGYAFTEHGFHLFPELVESATPSGSGGSLTAGEYFYKFLYEWPDVQGQIYRSAPSRALQATTTTGTSSVGLTLPTLRITTKSNVKIVVFRTKVNEDVYYRVTSLSNSTTADTVSYTDITADSVIDGNEILYTTGGVLENIAPPCCSLVCAYRGRAFIAGLPQQNRVWFSKEAYPGDGLGFSDSLYLDFAVGGGGITALGVLDDYLLVFKETSIFVVSGNGPTDAGEGFDYGTPRQLSAEVGCVEPGSVCNVPQGLLFKSNKGFYLIDKGLNVVYVGNGVHAYNSQFVTGSVLVPDRNVALFVCRDDGPATRALVYDYQLNRWSTFTNHNGVAIDIWDNKVVLFRTDGSVYVQNNSRFDDHGVFYALRAVTGWLNTGQIQGYQRVRKCSILGEYKDKHRLRARFGYDYEDVYRQDVTIDPGAILGGTTYGTPTPYGSETYYGGRLPNYQFVFHLARQKCQALRVSIEDVAPTTGLYNETVILTGLSFIVGVIPGFNRIPTTKVFGTN